MSKLEWLRSLVEEVNQKHQKQDRLPSSSQNHSLRTEPSDQESPEPDELKAIYDKGLRGIIEPSKAFRHLQVHEAKPYAFYETYPTFDRLNLKQLQWYLYWRKLVQTGIYTDAREGYLFLYAFELLNLSFEPDPYKAIEMLIELYEAYKDRIPRIAAILPAWIGDMYAEFDKPELAACWYEKTAPQQYDTAVFETYERTDTVPPFSVWKPLLSEQTAFYRKHMEELDMCFAMLMEPLDQYFRKKRKKTLLEVVLPEKWIIEHARYYDWAVIERPVPSRRKISYAPRYRGRSSSLDLLSACLRYLENHFREEAGIRLLKVRETLLVKPLKALLDQLFQDFRALHPKVEPEKPEKKRLPKAAGNGRTMARQNQESERMAIKIDPTVVETLHDESDWVRDAILAIEDAEEQVEIQTEHVEADRKEMPDSIQQPQTSQASIEFDLQQMLAPTAMTGELNDAWQDFLQTLTEAERAFITWCLNRSVFHINILEAQEFVRARGLLLHPVLDTINEKALDGLGDILFEIVADEIYWNEEFATLING